MAILLLLVVSSILVALGWAAVAEARRSKAQQSEAQLRQLLTAGAAAAQATLRAGAAVPRGPHPLPLPAELSDAGATLSFTVSPTVNARHARATVRATLPGRRAEQTLDFARDGGAGGSWVLVSATLSAPGTSAPAAPPSAASAAPAASKPAATHPATARHQ
jgi:hypothetical protein